MNTTNLFVELIVIGFGGMLALTLIAIGSFGMTEQVWRNLTVVPVLVPMLGLTYVLGILVDRIADRIFCRLWESRIRKKHFGDCIADYQNARRVIALNSPQLYAIRQYARTRIRICRGWALNSIVLAVAASWYVIRQTDGSASALLFIIVTAMLLLFGSLFAWHSLVDSDYQNVKKTAMFIDAQNKS